MADNNFIINNLTGIKGLIFDLDDTLYDSKPIYGRGLELAFQCWTRECKCRPLHWDEFSKRYAAARHEVKNIAPQSPSRHSRLSYFLNLTLDVLQRPNPKLALQMDRAYTDAYRSIDFAPARRLLWELKKKYKLAVLTNQTLHAQLPKLETLDPEGTLIDVLVVSEEVGCEKPNPKIFEECLRRLCLRADEVVMIGDDWDNDVIGAINSGIAAVHVGPNATAPSGHGVNPKFIGSIRSIIELSSMGNFS
jgi:putative hydrolase of the HAD superfamily